MLESLMHREAEERSNLLFVSVGRDAGIAGASRGGGTQQSLVCVSVGRDAGIAGAARGGGTQQSDGFFRTRTSGASTTQTE